MYNQYRITEVYMFQLNYNNNNNNNNNEAFPKI